MVASISPLKLFTGRSGGYKVKIASALREIETQRRELENMRGRLGERRQRLFETTVRALQDKNRSKATIYAGEHAELRKVIRVVEASELALTQVSLRLQSMTEIGDAMMHVNVAFRSLKNVSKTMEGVMPALDDASSNINSTLTETMARMGQLSPSISVDVRTENSEDLVEQARRFADEQADRLRQSLNVMPSRFEAEISSANDQVPILATAEESDEEAALGTIYSSPNDSKVEGEVLRYASTHNGVIDVSDTSSKLGIPQDEVEKHMIHLIAQGRVKT
jgi:division protein CdvB (Snf7/Vps24/ESCRT-III family)